MTVKRVKISEVGSVQIYGEDKKFVEYVAVDENGNTINTKRQSFEKTVPETEIKAYGKQWLSQLQSKEEKKRLYEQRAKGDKQMEKDKDLVGSFID